MLTIGILKSSTHTYIIRSDFTWHPRIYLVNADLFPYFRGKSSWLYVVPWGLRRILKWIKNTYNNPAIYITENGYSTSTGLEDSERVDCVTRYINEVLKGREKRQLKIHAST